MAKQQFRHLNHRWQQRSLDKLERVNGLIDEYAENGINSLTLRQIHYQFVARSWYENTPANYQTLCVLVNKGRWAGMVDWNAIHDGTRESSGSHDAGLYVADPSDYYPDYPKLDDVCDRYDGSDQANLYGVNRWVHQPKRVYLCVEKDALTNILQPVCSRYGVPYLATKGYSSASVLKLASEQMASLAYEHKEIVVLHFADHDPVGVDMTRDLQERLDDLASPADVTVERVALNMNQIQTYNPPSNMVKLSEKKSAGYADQYGTDCWELDALPPDIMQNLAKQSIEGHIDNDAWEQAKQDELNGKAAIEERGRVIVSELREALSGVLDE